MELFKIIKKVQIKKKIEGIRRCQLVSMQNRDNPTYG